MGATTTTRRADADKDDDASALDISASGATVQTESDMSTVVRVFEERRACQHFETLAGSAPRRAVSNGRRQTATAELTPPGSPPRRAVSNGRRNTELKFGNRRRLTTKRRTATTIREDDEDATELEKEDEGSLSDQNGTAMERGGAMKKKEKTKNQKNYLTSVALPKLRKKKEDVASCSE